MWMDKDIGSNLPLKYNFFELEVPYILLYIHKTP